MLAAITLGDLKTTLALGLRDARRGYLNWDVPEHRERILRRKLPAAPLWVFDEIHKYRSWRNLLKGLYDGRSKGQRIIVTGSARLDLYRRGGIRSRVATICSVCTRCRSRSWGSSRRPTFSS